MVYFLYIMAIFEFDPTKSDSNFEKHKIDFIQIQALWQDPDLIEFKAKSDTEPRYLLIGKIQGKHWSVVVTYRAEKTRIISARRSRKAEVKLYESGRV